MYYVSYKIQPCPTFPNGHSDQYGAEFASIKDAQRFIDQLDANPASVGCIDEMKDASKWVTDNAGNMY